MTRQRSVRSGLVPRQRFIARRILASTYRLVDQVMAEDWERVPGTLKERRSMLAGGGHSPAKVLISTRLRTHCG